MRNVAATLSFRTPGSGLMEITEEVRSWLASQGVTTGLLTLFCRHTSASLLIQENAARAVRTGILTGTILAVARVGGETAPLIFTAGFSQFPLDMHSVGALAESFASPTPNLTVTMYQFAMSPYPNWIALGWVGALLVTLGVLLLTVVARLLLYWGTK